MDFGGKIIVMTSEQLDELVNRIAQAVAQPQAPTPHKGDTRYVYGLRGISDLFNVSHTTAQQYKNSFLAPAVSQRGRKIIVNADMALQLYHDHHG